MVSTKSLHGFTPEEPTNLTLELALRYVKQALEKQNEDEDVDLPP